MIAVLREDVDPGPGNRSADCTELTRLVLLEPPNQHFAERDDFQSRISRRSPRYLTVLKQEMSVRAFAHGEYAAAFNAYPRLSHCPAKAGKFARTVGE